MSHLVVQTLELRLAVRRGGAVLPWIGPALRGIVARQLKNMVCRHPLEERERRWRYCDGCPHWGACTYGRLYEPENRADARTARGQTEAARPLILAPRYPLPERVDVGFSIPARVTLIESEPDAALSDLLAALALAGRSPGLGPDHVRFDVQAEPRAAERSLLRAEDLPPAPDAFSGRLPRVGVGLEAPLFLARRDERKRRRILPRPTFGELFRAAVRALSNSFAQRGVALRADFAALTAAADRVRCAEDIYEPFQQRNWSNRQEQRRELQGVVGGALFHDVPLPLLPWLLWGGRLSVGTHRVAGAGGWRVVLD